MTPTTTAATPPSEPEGGVPAPMTPAEFRAITERLGLSMADVGRLLDVRHDTIRNWFSGRRSVIPNNVAAAMLEHEDRTAQIVDEQVAAHSHDSEPVLTTYNSDKQFWEARPDLPAYPARWHRIVTLRVAERLRAPSMITYVGEESDQQTA